MFPESGCACPWGPASGAILSQAPMVLHMPGLNQQIKNKLGLCSDHKDEETELRLLQFYPSVRSLKASTCIENFKNSQKLVLKTETAMLLLITMRDEYVHI